MYGTTSSFEIFRLKSFLDFFDEIAKLYSLTNSILQLENILKSQIDIIRKFD